MEISNNNKGSPININAMKQGTKTIPPPYSFQQRHEEEKEERIKGRSEVERYLKIKNHHDRRRDTTYHVRELEIARYFQSQVLPQWP